MPRDPQVPVAGYLVVGAEVHARLGGDVADMELAAELAGKELVLVEGVRPELETAPRNLYRTPGGDIARKPEPPAPWSRWDAQAEAWVDDLALAREAKRADINAQRDAADRGQFEYAGRRFDADAASQSRITAVALVVARTRALPDNFPGAWKDADNGYLPIPDTATWDAFYGAMVAQGTANFARSEALKARLAAATTVEEVAAITWKEPS